MAIPAIRHWPMLRVFVPFALGICLQFYMPVCSLFLFSTFFICMLLSAVYGKLSAVLQFRFQFLTGILIIFLAFTAGMIALHFKTSTGKNNCVNISNIRDGLLLLRLTEDPADRGKTLKAIADLVEYRRPDTSFRLSGSLQVVFLKDSSLPNLSVGQLIIVNKTPDTIADNSNPGGFNFKTYSLRQGISHQLFLTKKDFTVSELQMSLPEKFLGGIRHYILASIRKYVKSQEETGLAEALLIGYKNDLDKGLVQSYSNTGVVHVIAISGLHLALIYWILGKSCDLLKFHQKRIRPFVVITGLWIFALLAGASPSVVRSAVMFTVIVAGELLQRKAHILNSLAASAFMLLCYNPYWLWDLGFQLSYIAVLSLIVTAKPINNALYFKNPIISNLWSLVSVTLAAQVLTTPLTLFNFHKFPLLFLFTNCICVPLSSLLLIGELLLCCLAWNEHFGTWLGYILLYGLRFMNDVVRFFERYPFSTFQPVQINIMQTLSLYITVAFFTYWLIKKEKIAIYFCLVALLIFSIIRIYSFRQADNQVKIVIYNIPSKLLIDLFQGRGVRSFEYRKNPVNESEIRQYVQPNRIQSRIPGNQVRVQQFPGQNIAIIGGIRVGLQTMGRDQFVNTGSPLDILIVSHNSLSKSLKSIAGLKVRLVVADATNSRASLARYRAFFHSKNIPYHSVSEQGAFVRNLN